MKYFLLSSMLIITFVYLTQPVFLIDGSNITLYEIYTYRLFGHWLELGFIFMIIFTIGGIGFYDIFLRNKNIKYLCVGLIFILIAIIGKFVFLLSLGDLFINNGIQTKDLPHTSINLYIYLLLLTVGSIHYNTLKHGKKSIHKKYDVWLPYGSYLAKRKMSLFGLLVFIILVPIYCLLFILLIELSIYFLEFLIFIFKFIHEHLTSILFL